MAKKPAARPAPRIEPSQPGAITIRRSANWKSWLEDSAGRMRTMPTAVNDLAPARLAQREGFREPPPRI